MLLLQLQLRRYAGGFQVLTVSWKCKNIHQKLSASSMVYTSVTNLLLRKGKKLFQVIDILILIKISHTQLHNKGFFAKYQKDALSYPWLNTKPEQLKFLKEPQYLFGYAKNYSGKI